MYDKTVRRRRAVLMLLVVLSLILLTAYFGEAPSGRLHSVQRGFLTVISPIQDGANKALKPVRDLFGWFGDTLHAKSQRDALRKQNDILRKQVVSTQLDQRSLHDLLALFHLDNSIGANSYHPVTATAIAQSPNIWYSRVTIDKGTNAGVHVDDPVLNGDGIVGKVTQTASDGAVVSLISDSSVGVSAMISSTGARGILQPKVGDPNTLLMQYLPANTQVNKGDYVVTSGTVSSQGDSLFPKGIPIGQVTKVENPGPEESVDVSPLADLHNIDYVQVLTVPPGSAAARAGQIVASLPVGQASGAPGAQLAQSGGGG